MTDVETAPTLADPACEADVVGSLLLADTPLVDEILACCEPGDMWSGAHRTITEAVADLRRHDHPTDTTAVARHLADHGHLEHVGGHQALADLVHHVPSPASGPWYAAQVADLARRRRIRQHATNLAHAVSDRETDVDTLVADATDRMTTMRQASGVLDADQLTDDALAELDRGDEPIGYPAPWVPLSRTMRIVPGWLHLLHGHRSAGKSAVLDALTVELAERHGLRTVVWSPESAPAARHKARLAAVRTDTPMGQLTASPDAVTALDWCSSHITHLDHHHVQRVDAILAQAAALRARGQCDVLVIDPWTRVDMWSDAGKSEGWDRMLQRQLIRVVAWARSSGVAVIVGCHPKNVEHNTDARPPKLKPSDLHGGAMWGNCADAIWHVWRDHTDPSPASQVAEIHVQKVKEEPAGGRMGARADLFRSESGRYVPISERQEPM